MAAICVILMWRRKILHKTVQLDTRYSVLPKYGDF